VTCADRWDHQCRSRPYGGSVAEVSGADVGWMAERSRGLHGRRSARPPAGCVRRGRGEPERPTGQVRRGLRAPEVRVGGGSPTGRRTHATHPRSGARLSPRRACSIASASRPGRRRQLTAGDVGKMADAWSRGRTTDLPGLQDVAGPIRAAGRTRYSRGAVRHVRCAKQPDGLFRTECNPRFFTDPDDRPATRRRGGPLSGDAPGRALRRPGAPHTAPGLPRRQRCSATAIHQPMAYPEAGEPGPVAGSPPRRGRG
jgi:hypothetical protein